MAELDFRLAEHRDLWEKKPGLRAVYADYHNRILRSCKAGPILEIGAGSGHLSELRDNVVSTDILSAPWLDLRADAQQLPFRDAMFDNIVMIDVLHHLPTPKTFFQEAERILRPGGRIVMIEPGITPLSFVMFKLFHPEPVEMGQDPLGLSTAEESRDPFESNQAIPTLLFKRRRHLKRFRSMFPMLRVLDVRWLSLLAYPLSGGFRAWSLLPQWLAKPLLRLEERLMSVLGPVAAFRVQVTLERAS